MTDEELDALENNLAVRGKQDREMSNHYVHRMEVDRVAAKSAITTLRAQLAEARAGELAWAETAKMHLKAEQAFLSWLRDAGEHLRDEGVTICDDGTDSGEVLAAKVAECVGLLKARADRAEAEVRSLKAAIFGSGNYAPDLKCGNFVEMAQTLHAAQKGGLDRADRAEAALAARSQTRA